MPQRTGRGEADREPAADPAAQGRPPVGLDKEAARILSALHSPQMRLAPQVEQAMSQRTLVLLRQLDAACASADQPEQAATSAFRTHADADAEVIASFPGLGPLLGARVLAELGDDHDRFTDARALKAYAGSAPITRASGKKTSVTARRVKDDRRRQAGERHVAALRNLFNRLLGCLHHCLQHHIPDREAITFPTATQDRQGLAA